MFKDQVEIIDDSDSSELELEPAVLQHEEHLPIKNYSRRFVDRIFNYVESQVMI